MKDYFLKYTSAAPLVVFRIGLGVMLFASTIRFWLKGWIEELYIKPTFYFSYYGFDFVKPLGNFTYLLFFICAAAALCVALGYKYRIAIIALFVSFTYIELIDKATYLNHYYFVSMICFLLIFLPANVSFSIDALKNKKLQADQIPVWCIDAVKLFVCFLYIFAGIAKINSDWLLNAMPLKIWLPARNDLPVIGYIFNYSWVAYAFSWIGCIYDLCIPFLLWNKHTRPGAYILVIIFHTLTSILFPIGMFPYIMIVTACIFFDAGWHQKCINHLKSLFGAKQQVFTPLETKLEWNTLQQHFVKGIFFVFFAIQLLFPFRYIFYPGNLFWTEEGYRFSWRVMLMEKAGYAQFTVTDDSGKYITVNNNDFLTVLQEKMMSTQPDMMLQYAHHLASHYTKQGFKNPKVYAETYVALNGRLGKPLIDSKTDLASESDSFKHKSWILLYND